MARAVTREGMGVKLRRCREKPQRATVHEQERVYLCNKMRRWPLKRLLEGIDLIIDNKRFEMPTTPAARGGHNREGQRQGLPQRLSRHRLSSHPLLMLLMELSSQHVRGWSGSA